MVNKNFLKFITFCITIVFCFLPLNIIIGSKSTWFSCSSMAIPALGYHLSLLYVILFIFTKSLFSSYPLYFFILHRLPLILSIRALQKRDWKVFIAVPLVAMILFCVHPIGQQVFYYSWYWFVPMIMYVFVQDTLYSRALASSFIAHAVGSVVWLYLGHIPIETWIALMPIVPIERLFITIGMIGCVALFENVIDWYNHKAIA